MKTQFKILLVILFLALFYLSYTATSADIDIKINTETTIKKLSSTSSQQSSSTILIANAEHLNENKEFIEEITDEVKNLDNIWSSRIQNEHYLRITFRQNLTSSNDITIYPRVISGNPKIEIYEHNQIEKIAEFTSIQNNQYNKIYLADLQNQQDTFDLKIIEGEIEFDHIIDPVQELFEDCTSISDWTISSDWTVAGGITCRASNTDEDANMTSATFDLSNDISANLSYTRTTAQLDAGEYLKVYVSNGTQYYLITTITANEGPITETFQLQNYITFTSAVSIRFGCFNSAANERCDLDDINVTSFQAPDNEYPLFSDFSETPANNSQYSQSQTYQFNTTIMSTNGTAGLEFNGINYTASNLTSSMFNATLQNLAAGTYSYYFWAFGNGTNKNYNTSQIRFYTISKAQQSLTPLLNGNNANLIIIYPQQINASFSGANQTPLSININGTEINIAQNYTWTAGGWIINYSAPENQNYTAFTAYLNLTINKAQSQINLTLNTTEANITIRQGEAIFLNGTLLSGDQSAILRLYSNNSLINQGTSPISNLTSFTSLGLYNITLIYQETQNYTQNSKTYFVNVITSPDITPPSITSLTETPTDPAAYSSGAKYEFNSTIVDDIAIDKVLIEFNGINYTVFNHTSNVYNFTISNLAAGTYNYYWRANDSAGNTNVTQTFTYTIAPSSGQINTFLNHSRTNITITQGTSIYLNTTLVTGQGTIQIYNNGSLINQGQSPLSNLTNFTILGLYNITAIYQGNQNYTSSSETFYVNVTQSTDTTSPYFTLIPENITINYTQRFQTNFQASDNIAIDTFSINWTTHFTINQSGTLQNTTQLASGTYLINITVNDTSNNLNSTLFQVNVNKALSSCIISSNSPQSYPSPINVSASCNNPEASANLYRNNLEINSENSQDKILGAGAYNYIINVTQTQNYTNASSQTIVTINQNTTLALSLSISPSTNVNYPTQTTAIGTGCPAELICNLYANHTGLTTNPHTITFGVEPSPIQYTYNTSGNTNYSSAQAIQILTINQNTSSQIFLFLNHTQANITILNNTEISINATLIIGFGIIKLFNNNSLINQGSSPLYNLTLFNTHLGLFNITSTYEENANYSSVSQTFYVNVTAPPVIDSSPPILTLNSPLNNQFINSPNVTFNITLNENGSSIFYSLNDGIINISMSTIDNRNYNATNTSIADGQYTVRFFVNDTSNNFNNTVQTTFTIDTTRPQLSLVQPQNTSYNTISLQINFTASDTNLQTCWYTTNNGITNTSLTNCANTSYTASQDSTTLTLYANDSANNINSSSVTFFVDSITPLISYTEPTSSNNSFTKQNSIFINTTITEANFASITFTLHNSTSLVNRTTFTTQTLSINFTNLPDTTYFYNVTINDTLGNSNSTETRTITLDTTLPNIQFTSPTETSNSILNRNYILINTTASDANLANITIYLYNSTNNLINETTSSISPLFINFSNLNNGVYYFNATAVDILNNQNTTETRNVTINTISQQQEINLSLTCEVGGPYQQGALILVQGNLTNQTSPINNAAINLSIYKNNLLNTTKIITTSSNGNYQTTFENLSTASYTLNATTAYQGINASCIDTFQIGSPASLVLDKIATIHNISNSQIIYNITLRLTNKGLADSINTNISDSDSTNSPYLLTTLQSNTNTQISYLLNLTRQNTTQFYLTSIAAAQGIDTFSNSLITTNSTSINLTIPPTSIGMQIVITKNIIFISETSLNITYNITSTLFNSGDEDLTNINYIDTDISSIAVLINLTKGSSHQLSNTLTIAKAASNTQHQFALGTAAISSQTFYSNRPVINIPGYGGPADIIVHAPASVQASTSFTSIIEIKNANEDIGQDFPVSYYITNIDETQNFSSGSQTIFVSANSTINITAALTSPPITGAYKLKAVTSWPAGTASAFDSFEVTSASPPQQPPSQPSQSPGSGGTTLPQKIPSPSQQEQNETLPQTEPPTEQPPESQQEKEEIICSPPYIRHGAECCLDENNNAVCDEDETPDNFFTGFIIKNLPEVTSIKNIISILLILIILVIISILIAQLIKRKKKKHTNRLTKILGLKVYTSDGTEIGKLKNILLSKNHISELKIKIARKTKKKMKLKIKGISIRYKYLQAIKDIIIVNEKILNNLQETIA